MERGKSMIGDKIRSYREFRGYNQIELAKLSGINVGTIRKYETGVRSPKPDQLEKIAKALGLNYSVFFDFNLETSGDIMALLFAIDDAVDIKFNGERGKGGKMEKGTIGLHFQKPMLENFLKDWADFKTALEHDRIKVHYIEDKEQQAKEFKELDELYEEWKLKKMGTNIGSSYIVKKGTPDDEIRVKVHSFDVNDLLD